jgi:hypothetical protein
MNEVTVEYVAGFFDADGCVSIHHNRKGHIGDKLRFTNTNKNILIYIQKKFCGSKLYLKHNHLTKGKDGKNWNKCWSLVYHGKYGVSLAKLMYPFLYIKKEKLGKFIERNKKNAERI